MSFPRWKDLPRNFLATNSVYYLSPFYRLIALRLSGRPSSVFFNKLVFMVLYYFIILMRHFGTILFTFQDYASQLKPVNRQSFVYGVLTLCSYRRPADLLIVTRNQLQWECRRDKFEAIHFVSYLLTSNPRKFHLRNTCFPVSGWLFRWW